MPENMEKHSIQPFQVTFKALLCFDPSSVCFRRAHTEMFFHKPTFFLVPFKPQRSSAHAVKALAHYPGLLWE